jgi:O-antigen ligase
MTNTTALIAVPPNLAFRGTSRDNVARPAPVHFMARFAFWTILILSLTNAIGVYVVAVKRLQDDTFELSAYPIVFGICTVIVLAFSKGRVRSTLLVVAWAFWLTYFLFGFLGKNQMTGSDIRGTLRVAIKPWMTAIGLPWLALRAISQDKIPRLFHVTVIVICLGAGIGFLQILLPGFMEGMLANQGRAEGLWGIPGNGGAICAFAVFLTLICPFKSRLMNWATRLILVAGVVTTLSRGAIAAMLLAWIVYAICSRQFWTLLKTAIGLALFWVITLAILESTEIATKPGHEQQRLSSVRAFLALEWGQKTFTDRTSLWQMGLDAILSKGGFLFGLGHGSMTNIVVTESQQIGPHNHYIYVLGNSGILAFLGFLALHFAYFQQAFKLTDRKARAAVIAIATVWAVYDWADNILIEHPTVGGIFACVVVVCAYAGRTQTQGRRPPMPMQHPSARPRPV